MPSVDLNHANHVGLTHSVVGTELRLEVTVSDGVDGLDGSNGADGVGVPAGGSAGQALTKVDGTDYNTAWTTPATLHLESVAGAAGFANVTGAVVMDLNLGRHFHHTLTGHISSLTFSNVPLANAFSAEWTWVLRVGPSGPYTLSNPPTVVWLDGSDWTDLDLDASAENIVYFWQVGTTTFASLITNGTLALDPVVMSFPADGTQLYVVTGNVFLDLGNVTHVQEDGTAGTGSLSYKRNGVGIPAADALFGPGQVLGVTMTGSTTPSAVSVPREL
jgi:hypothetical protein